MATKTQEEAAIENRQPIGSGLIAYEEARLPITKGLAEKLEVSAAQWRVLIDQIFPGARTVGSVVMAVAYCKARNLDIFKRPVHIVPMWSNAQGRMVETVWPGISEVRTTAVRTKQYAGIDAIVWGPDKTETFTGTVEKWEDRKKVSKKIEKTVTFPEWASVVVYRMIEGHRCAFHAIVYWKEAYATIGKTNIPNDMWEERPRGQLGKCVEAAALRMAFPEEAGGMLTAEEMEGRRVPETATAEQVAREVAKSTRAPNPDEEIDEVSQALRDQGATVEDASFEDIVDGETGEVTEHGDDDSAPDPDDDAGDIDPDEAYFAELRDGLTAAETPEDVEEVWNKADPLAKFEKVPLKQKLANSLKAARLQMIAKKK